MGGKKPSVPQQPVVAVAPPPPPPPPPEPVAPEPVAPLPDDQQVKKAKKKDYVRQILSSGRQSTIKTQGDEKLG